MKEISILITSYNRKDELKDTLSSLQSYINDGVSIIICDDGSKDGTSEFIKNEYPEIQLLINPVNKGLIYSRNLLMSQVKTPFAISLDDDANFLSLEPFENISQHFNKESKCGVIAFRIFWGLKDPKFITSNESFETVKSFVGCGHCWRMEAWKDIPQYPEWYEFYGEEAFASIHLFRKGWKVHYLPEILIHHRVDNQNRKKHRDYYIRVLKSIRADWYNYLIFYPEKLLLQRFAYSLWIQIKLKVIKKKDWRILIVIVKIIGNIFRNSKRIIKCRSPLSENEFKTWENLSPSKIYWKPK